MTAKSYLSSSSTLTCCTTAFAVGNPRNQAQNRTTTQLDHATTKRKKKNPKSGGCVPYVCIPPLPIYQRCLMRLYYTYTHGASGRSGYRSSGTSSQRDVGRVTNRVCGIHGGHRVNRLISSWVGCVRARCEKSLNSVVCSREGGSYSW